MQTAQVTNLHTSEPETLTPATREDWTDLSKALGWHIDGRTNDPEKCAMVMPISEDRVFVSNEMRRDIMKLVSR